MRKAVPNAHFTEEYSEVKRDKTQEKGDICILMADSLLYSRNQYNIMRQLNISNNNKNKKNNNCFCHLFFN